MEAGLLTLDRLPILLDRYRGTFTLNVLRLEHRRRDAGGFYMKGKLLKGEWLKGEIEREDVVDEVEAILTDPRDHVIMVSVWSNRHNCFVSNIRGDS